MYAASPGRQRLLRESLALLLPGLAPRLPGLEPPSRRGRPASAQPTLTRRRAGAAGRGGSNATKLKCEALRLGKRTQRLISPVSQHSLTMPLFLFV